MPAVALAFLWGLVATAQEQQTPVAGAPQPTVMKVLIVSGINKDPEERQAKDRAVLGMRRFFAEQAGVAPQNLHVLVGPNSFVADPSGSSTAENVRAALAQLASEVKPSDRFVFYYTGQANIVGEKLRFNVPGPDFTQEDLTVWLAEVKADTRIVILDCPGGGLAVKPLSRKGTMVICGARSDQMYSPQFSKYFVPALTENGSDEDKDGKISLLEAFRRTAEQVDAFYRERDLVKTENPILDDNGDGVPSQQPWQYEKPTEDGWEAARTFLTSGPKGE